MKKLLPIILILLCLFGCNNKSFFIEENTAPKDQRIISLAPSITNMIIALGGEDKLVGVTKFCPNPNHKWTEIGGYLDFNKEVFLSLKPTIVFLGPYHTEAKEICESQGIKYIELNLADFRSIRPNIMTIGENIGKTKKATELVNNFNREIMTIKPCKNHKKVLIVLDRNYNTKDLGKIYIVGDGGIFAEPINLIGGINPYQGLVETPALTNEGITKLNPDIIIDIIDGEHVKGDISKDWLDLNINAVKKNNLFVISDKRASVPDEKFYKTVLKLNEIVNKAK